MLIKVYQMYQDTKKKKSFIYLGKYTVFVKIDIIIVIMEVI